MTIPPFPSQDLAKLVLGYLAEEQLMTAYDEFLQASPYLDALRNEYDRIFMTSLRNILAEYRAVKIFVETCKPLALRRKLVQCSTLLDVVKILVNHVDISKVQSQDAVDKISLIKKNTPNSTKQAGCDVCNALSISSCVCKSRLSNSSVHTSSHVQTSTLESSVETTALEDLPGNHFTARKKHVRVLEKETILLESNLSHNLGSKCNPGVVTNSDSGHSLSNGSSINVPIIKSSENLPTLGLNSLVKAANPECREKIEEFNNILNQVCKEKSSVDSHLNVTGSLDSRTSNTTTFQDFASGVGSHDNRNVPVPDSSTSENNNFPNSKEIKNKKNSYSTSNKEIPQNESATIETCHYPRILPKPTEQKIQILSDVKVDNAFKTNNVATSTPLMQTIVINGTPAYKPNVPNNNYTKDEIMAMPTIIVVPASGKTKSVAHTPYGMPQSLNPVTKTVSSTKKLGPLVIDVSSSPGGSQTVLSLQQEKLEAGLVKTVVETTKNATVPKDNIITCAAESNTPQVLPPLRKSSSTPRRNSHIRVLDFTTPRRILHETINEQAPSSQSSDEPIEVVLSKSPNVTFTDTDKIENNIVDMNIVKVHKIGSSSINITPTQDHIKPKRNNWDTDLRALAIAHESHTIPFVKTKAKSRSKKKVDGTDNQKEKTTDGVDAKKMRGKSKIVSPKSKKSKRRRKIDEEEDDGGSVKVVEGCVNVSVKPTIKIIPVEKYCTQESKKENDGNQNKSNTDEANETPEAERIFLQNEIGAKLNISELLETPYKQALYDIQMETPKFLGPDLPGEPISDIKIMNIPTPRFFDTPKPAQATPSSYSSRPTDYSSGGSYYKPDDQDYIPMPDLECAVSSSKPEFSIDAPKDKENDVKKSRPVRQCTKNVSYFNSASISNKTKDRDADDKMEIASSWSDSTAANSSFEKKEPNIKTPRNAKPKTHTKSETKKKTSSSIKKYKSPIKKSNTFMKIKPRRPTPTKESYSGGHKRKSDKHSSKTQIKKKTNGKEKHIHMTPIITCAPTKSRRKSSTPRKLHCTKTFNSESSGHDFPEINATNVKENIAPDPNLPVCHDSDTGELALRWSDDGSQDTKHNEKPSTSEIEDITKIKEYIETTAHNKPNYTDGKGALHVDLIKRGFDAETAKIIERDLLDTPPHTEQSVPCHVEIILTKKDDSINKSVETDTSSTNDLHIVQDAEEIEEDEIELAIHECNEESNNYFTVCHDDTKDIPRGQPIKLKDKFSMEVCIDDGVSIRLRANDLNVLFDHDSSNLGDSGYSFRETEIAVSSISNIDKLYTPLKDQMKATCYDIFDSTLTSLDTPLKPNSPKSKQYVVPEVEIVVEEEKIDSKEKTDSRKRKRLRNSNSPEQHDNDTKKTKSEAQYLLNSTNIQNIDIESVLKKLHGP